MSYFSAFSSLGSEPSQEEERNGMVEVLGLVRLLVLALLVSEALKYCKATFIQYSLSNIL